MMRILRPLIYLWSLPTTLVGLFFLPIALVTGGSARIVWGVLEIEGGVIRFLLQHCTFLATGASAMTLGHVVLGRDRAALDRTRRHERIHVRQCERWGVLFLPAYGLASLIILLRGGRPYYDNPFEREAYAMENSPKGQDRLE